MENLFINQDLFLPLGDAGVTDALLRQWVARRAGEGVEQAPFDRQIDLWWLALCLGVRKGQRAQVPPAERRTKFADGAILSSDPWRITHLSLLGIAEIGEDALSRPTEVLRIAHEYVVTGIRQLRQMLEGAADPALTLWTRLDIPDEARAESLKSWR